MLPEAGSRVTLRFKTMNHIAEINSCMLWGLETFTSFCSCSASSLASYTLYREEGSGHTATIELSPQQKPIRSTLFVDHICCHGASYYLTAVFHNCIPQQLQHDQTLLLHKGCGLRDWSCISQVESWNTMMTFFTQYGLPSRDKKTLLNFQKGLGTRLVHMGRAWEWGYNCHMTTQRWWLTTAVEQRMSSTHAITAAKTIHIASKITHNARFKSWSRLTVKLCKHNRVNWIRNAMMSHSWPN